MYTTSIKALAILCELHGRTTLCQALKRSKKTIPAVDLPLHYSVGGKVSIADRISCGDGCVRPTSTKFHVSVNDAD